MFFIIKKEAVLLPYAKNRDQFFKYLLNAFLGKDENGTVFPNLVRISAFHNLTRTFFFQTTRKKGLVFQHVHRK